MMEFLIKTILLTHLNSVIFHFLSIYGTASYDTDTVNENLNWKHLQSGFPVYFRQWTSWGTKRLGQKPKGNQKVCLASLKFDAQFNL